MTLHERPRNRRYLLLATSAVAGLLALSSCGTSSGSEASEDATTTTAAEATTTAGGSSSDTETADEQTDPQDHRGEIGKQITYDCPADGVPATIWGVETYTDDSSVCTAAVHVGLLTFAEGGEVTIEIAAGEDSYDSGVANDVSSTSYGEWAGSFTFPDAPPGSGSFEPSLESWGIKASSQGLGVGETFEVACTPGGEPRPLWGTETYTADSSICTAAVHSGLITIEDGGTVTIELAEGEDSYEGTEANGVESSSYGSYSSSFTFPTS